MRKRLSHPACLLVSLLRYYCRPSSIEPEPTSYRHCLPLGLLIQLTYRDTFDAWNSGLQKRPPAPLLHVVGTHTLVPKKEAGASQDLFAAPCGATCFMYARFDPAPFYHRVESDPASPRGCGFWARGVSNPIKPPSRKPVTRPEYCAIPWQTKQNHVQGLPCCSRKLIGIRATNVLYPSRSAIHHLCGMLSYEMAWEVIAA